MMRFQEACVLFCVVLLVNMLVGISDAKMEHRAETSNEEVALPQLTIPQGHLQGINLVTRHNRKYFGFLGIPYAQPPIGNLRFSSPVPAVAWDGTLNANVDGNICVQSGDVGDEDCLYLNVFTPQLPGNDNSTLLPVMVFIPGGGFEEGGGISTTYGANSLLDADIVHVNMNYRLGPLGFLSTGDEVAPGNWGLKDQVLALQWVQDNIAYFGGDPRQVTIFGQSAGGASVQLLALSELTIGLFQKFISQSGAAYGSWVYHPRATAANRALKLGEELGCPIRSSAHLIDCLRGIDATTISMYGYHFYKWKVYPMFSWGPTDEPNVDGAFITDSPANLVAAGKLRDLPSMTGVVADEGSMFTPGRLPDSDTFQDFLDNFDDVAPIVLQYSDQVEDVSGFTAALKKFYFNNDLTTNRTRVWLNCAKLVGDAFFVYPVYNSLQQQVATAENAHFLYTFAYRGSRGLGDNLDPDGGAFSTAVVHGDELLYIFTQWPLRAQPEVASETDSKMRDAMVQLWTSFAINGTPETAAMISNTTWLPYSSEGNYLRIGSGSDGSLHLQRNFFQERMEFWSQLTATGPEI